MRRTRLRRRSDGLYEVARCGRLRHAGVAAAIALLALPTAPMVILALVAVVPVVALAVPPALVAALGFALWSQREHRGRTPGQAAVLTIGAARRSGPG